jgi:hypothetical protein
MVRRTPTDEFLKPESSARAFTDRSFIAEFKSALISVANQDQQTLILMKKHQRQKNCGLADLLRALLLDYADNKAAYPY